MRGPFIVFEGPEGSGKSTQASRLAARLRSSGLPVRLTREPGGTAIGEQVRAILLSDESAEMRPETEALLYAAARAQHVAEVLRPGVERGEVVICDRFADSSIAYQAGGRGLPAEEVTGIQRLATGGLTPDLRILLDLPAEAGLARRFSAGEDVNRLDRAELAFHQRVRDCYLGLAAAAPEVWAVIDAGRSPEEVAADVDQAVDRLLDGWPGGRAANAAGTGSGDVE